MDKVIIGDATLYHGDCMDIMPTLGKVDAVVTDPPYGIGIDGRKEHKGCANKKQNRKGHDVLGWDELRPSKAIFEMILDASYYQIIWGGNYFADYLPPSRGWLFWDKGQHMLDQSAGELAYTNIDMSLKAITINRSQLNIDGSVHPTQKPVRLMRWAIRFLMGRRCNSILDPFMGSGTTGVACAHEYRFIGIEKERKYFDIACERIEAAYAQGRLAL